MKSVLNTKRAQTILNSDDDNSSGDERLDGLFVSVHFRIAQLESSTVYEEKDWIRALEHTYINSYETITYINSLGTAPWKRNIIHENAHSQPV